MKQPAGLLSHPPECLKRDPLSLNINVLIEFLLAISLSAASGFRIFVPFLIMSGAAVLGHVDLPTQFDWVETPQALGLFASALILEMIGYSIPWFDHVLDIVATPIAMLAGTLLTGTIAPDMEPLVKWTLAIAAGGGTAGLTKILTNLLRGTSTALTGGLTNPLYALLEVAIAIALSVLAIAAPIAAGVVVLGLIGFGLYRVGRLILGMRRQQQS
jgi:hypothetical protein